MKVPALARGLGGVALRQAQPQPLRHLGWTREQQAFDVGADQILGKGDVGVVDRPQHPPPDIRVRHQGLVLRGPGGRQLLEQVAQRGVAVRLVSRCALGPVAAAAPAALVFPRGAPARPAAVHELHRGSGYHAA